MKTSTTKFYPGSHSGKVACLPTHPMIWKCLDKVRKADYVCCETLLLLRRTTCYFYTLRQLLKAIKKDVLPSHHHSNVIFQFVCHCDSRYVGRMSQRLEERIKQHVSRSIANPLPRTPAKSFPAFARSTYAYNSFTNPPLVNIFFTTPNALFTTATKNFLFSLEVALLFIFLLLKQLSLNLSNPFFVNKKNSYIL